MSPRPGARQRSMQRNLIEDETMLAAAYRRGPGESEFRALALDALRFEGAKLAEITVFRSEVFPASGLPPTL